MNTTPRLGFVSAGRRVERFMRVTSAGIFAIVWFAGSASAYVAPVNHVAPGKPKAIVPSATASGCPDGPPAFLRGVAADPASRLHDLRGAAHPRLRNAAPIGTIEKSAGFSLEVERPSPEIVDARLEAVEVLHEGDRYPFRALRVTCPANARCRVPGLVARQVAYEIESVRWTAGAGWPEYRVATPSGERRPEMRYRNALMHQVVLTIGGDYFGGCPAAATAAVDNAGEVSFAVNDDKYDDNVGLS
jgi:hypothetical protein